MADTIRAVFKNGKFEPFEDVPFVDGDEVMLSISKNSNGKDAFDQSAGAWKDLVDCDQLIEDVYTSRLIATRKEPKL